MNLSARDIWEFNEYLRNCTLPQVHGVLGKELSRGMAGEAYAELARWELKRRAERERDTQ